MQQDTPQHLQHHARQASFLWLLPLRVHKAAILLQLLQPNKAVWQTRRCVVQAQATVSLLSLMQEIDRPPSPCHSQGDPVCLEPAAGVRRGRAPFRCQARSGLEFRPPCLKHQSSFCTFPSSHTLASASRHYVTCSTLQDLPRMPSFVTNKSTLRRPTLSRCFSCCLLYVVGIH